MSQLTASPSTRTDPVLPEDPVLLAGDRFLVAMWLAVVVVSLRVVLQVFVDYTAEGLRGDLLREHAIEHILLVTGPTARAWWVVAVLTLLPRGKGWVAWLRALACCGTTLVVLLGWPDGEIQYRPGWGTTRGFIGWAAVIATSLGVVMADRWATSPRRFFYRTSAAFRFMLTAVVLLVGGAAVVTTVHFVELRRNFMYVDRTLVDLLDEVENAKLTQAAETKIGLGSVLPNRDMVGVGNRPSIIVPPMATVEFTIKPRGNSRFVFSYGVDQRSTDDSSVRGSVSFFVRVNDEEQFREEINPWDDHEERRWFDAAVNLRDFAGKQTRVTIGTESSLGKPVRAGFGRPRIARRVRVPRTPAESGVMNVVLIAVDSLRADHLQCYGYERKTSPAIDGLARHGILYRNAYAPSSWTWPAAASIQTGLYPAAHGVVAEDRCFLSDSIQTLAERFQQRRGGAITTGGWSANPLISRDKNFHQGFEVWKEFRFRPGGFVTREFTDFIRRHQEYPFYAYLNLSDPHAPYAPPPRFRSKFSADGDLEVNRDLDLRAADLAAGRTEAKPTDAALRQMVDLYDAEVRAVDHEIRRIRQVLENAGVWDRTIVVFTGVHGEEFLEHGGLTHGPTLHREVLHVPLIICDPRHDEQGIVIDEPVDTTRIAATILEIMEMPWSKPMSAPLPPWNSEPQPWIYGHTELAFPQESGPLALWSVQQGNHKLITTPSGDWQRLFDVAEDPGEERDVAAKHPDRVEFLRNRLANFVERVQENSPRRYFQDMDLQTRRALRDVEFVEDKDASGDRRGGSED